jgi:hypothetical protein
MTITYTTATGDSITLSPHPLYSLQRVDGTGNLRQAINTFRAPEQDGAFYISSSLEMRNITLEGVVVGQTVDAAFDARKRLLRAFTPKERGMLTFRDLQIPCVVEEAMLTVSNIARAPAFFISLLCPSPFFEALNETHVEIAAWLSGFHFPLEIPEDTGIEMGVRLLSQIVTVENDGDVPCGCTIIFTALGTLRNPELVNVHTGERLRLLVTMAAGETITVTTHFAGKRVVRSAGGTESNAFSLVDTGSSFLQLQPGRNTLRYDADENMDALEIRVVFRPQFLGV